MTKSALIKHILLAGLLAGILDILAAIILLAKGNVTGTFKFIASGAFGKAAFSGGADMIAWGVFFHFLIATSFAAGYFLLYPCLSILRKNKWLSAIIYGIFIWAWMNYVVLPLTLAPPAPFSWEAALRNTVIVTACVSLPVAWLAHRFYA